MNPNLLNYKPKKLIEYKKGFNKNGFSLFFTLIKLCKTLKFEILLKKYQKLVNAKKKKKKIMMIIIKITFLITLMILFHQLKHPYLKVMIIQI